jgi:hypothetical protein
VVLATEQKVRKECARHLFQHVVIALRRRKNESEFAKSRRRLRVFCAQPAPLEFCSARPIPERNTLTGSAAGR